jgi:hypothetical protein
MPFLGSHMSRTPMSPTLPAAPHSFLKGPTSCKMVGCIMHTVCIRTRLVRLSLRQCPRRMAARKFVLLLPYCAVVDY